VRNVSELHPHIVIEKVAPNVDNGRFPTKRLVGERCEVGADIFSDGYETLRGSTIWGACNDLYLDPARPPARLLKVASL
jgi:hypothetical protein